MKWHAAIIMAAGILAGRGAVAAAAAKLPAKTPPAKTPVAPKAAAPKVDVEVVNEFKIGGAATEVGSPVVDADGKYLYVPRYTHTQVIDTASGKVVADIPGHSALSVALVPDANRGFIANLQTVTVFDLKTNAVLGDIAVGWNLADIIYDSFSKRLLVRCGDTSLVPFAPDIDLKTGKVEPAIKFDGALRGAVADGRGMVYVTLYDTNIISVLDTRTMTNAAQWPLKPMEGPAAIFMDRLHGRLFVCSGSQMIILSACDGHVLDIIGMRSTAAWRFPAATAAYYDGLVYGVCGDGTMTVVGQKDDGAFAVEDMAKFEPNSQPVTIDEKSGKIYLPTQQKNDGRLVRDTFKILVLQKK